MYKGEVDRSALERQILGAKAAYKKGRMKDAVERLKKIQWVMKCHGMNCEKIDWLIPEIEKGIRKTVPKVINEHHWVDNIINLNETLSKVIINHNKIIDHNNKILDRLAVFLNQDPKEQHQRKAKG